MTVDAVTPCWTADPETPTERALAELWRELFDLERVGRNDDFFALGGHSLLATRLVARVRDRFGVELSLRRLFASPTVAGLARELAGGEGVADLLLELSDALVVDHFGGR